MQEMIEELISDIFGRKPIMVTKMPYGEMNEVYEVKLPGEEVILRANNISQPLEGTENNIKILSELGLPVPKVLHVDITKTKYPFAFIILEKIPGHDLRYELPHMTHQQISKLAKTIVGFQKKVKQLPTGQGYGFAAIGKKATSKSWAEIVEWDIQCGLPRLEGIVNQNGINRIKQKANQYEVYFSQVKPECFLDDITIKNVIMLDGSLQGIIDLDWVCYGDPLTMLGLTQAYIISDVNFDSLFYFQELCRYWEITKEQRSIVDFYSLIHATTLLKVRGNENNDKSVSRLVDAITRWVHNL